MFVPSVCQDYAIGKGGGWEGECGGWAGFLPFPGQWSVRLHFDPWREAWQRQLALCSSWERAPQHPLLRSLWDRGWESVGQDEAPALGCLQPAAAPGSWLCAPKPAVTTVVTTSHHSLRPPAPLATSSSPPSASAAFLRPLVPGSRAPSRWSSQFNVPPSALLVARPVGVCSMMRLPMQALAEGLDVAFVGVPLDTGTSNRPGAR